MIRAKSSAKVRSQPPRQLLQCLKMQHADDASQQINSDRLLAVEIVKRTDGGKDFVVLSKRWIVERTLLRLASIRLMVRKLCNPI
jgi:transposase